MSLKCPLILQVPKDPVLLKNYIFSRKAIEQYLLSHNTHPITNDIVSVDDIIICSKIKKLCFKYYNKKSVEKSLYSNFKIIDYTISINLNHEKTKILNRIAKFMQDKDAYIYGSWVYKNYYNKTNMALYYTNCKFEHCSLSLKYEDETFHPISYLSRKELQNINDIDIYIPTIKLSYIKYELIEYLTKTYNASIKIIKNNKYKLTEFLNNNKCNTIIIHIPILARGFMEIKCDIITSKNQYDIDGENNEIHSTTYKHLGLYPNILKRIFCNKHGFFYEFMKNYSESNREVFLNWCNEKYIKKETVTNIFDFSKIYEYNLYNYSKKVLKSDIGFTLHRNINIFLINKNNVLNDLFIYTKKLYIELDLYTIQNLSVKKVNSHMRFQIWCQNNIRLNYTYDIKLLTILNKIKNIFKILNILKKKKLINTYLNLLTNLIEGKILINLKSINYKVDEPEQHHISSSYIQLYLAGEIDPFKDKFKKYTDNIKESYNDAINESDNSVNDAVNESNNVAVSETDNSVNKYDNVAVSETDNSVNDAVSESDNYVNDAVSESNNNAISESYNDDISDSDDTVVSESDDKSISEYEDEYISDSDNDESIENYKIIDTKLQNKINLEEKIFVHLYCDPDFNIKNNSDYHLLYLISII